MTRLASIAIFFCATLLASWLGVIHIGLRPVFPTGFGLLLLLSAVPFAIVFEYYFFKWSAVRFIPALIGIAVLSLFHLWFVWVFLAMAVLLVDYGRPRQWKLLVLAVLITILGYATLWNVNYLILHRARGSLNDPSLKAMDIAFYSFLTGTRASYANIFPLVHNPLALLMSGNAYILLIAEIVLAVLLTCQSGDVRRVSRFLITLFGLYICGVAVFLIYPAVGPCLYYPDSLRAGSNPLISGMAADYQATLAGTGNLQGYGYFIALPSLHVLIAIFLQTFLFRYRSLFQMFLPINIVLVLSTVVLGYHYVADVGMAILIAIPVCVRYFQLESKAVL